MAPHLLTCEQVCRASSFENLKTFFFVVNYKLVKKKFLSALAGMCSDGRRVFRLCVSVDEMCRFADAYANNDLKSIRTHLDAIESFYISKVAKKEDVYRQMVYAARDINACVDRCAYWSANSVKLADRYYEFYPDNNRKIDFGLCVKTTRAYQTSRIACTLKVFYKFLRTLRGKKIEFNSVEAKDLFMNIRLTRQQFLKCGGYKRQIKQLDEFSFYPQILQAKRDMKSILERGRFSRSKLGIPFPEYISSDEEEEDLEDEVVILEGGDVEEDHPFIDPFEASEAIEDREEEEESDDDDE